MVGIYVFFLIEKGMQIRRARKEKRHRHEEHHAEQLSLDNHRYNHSPNTDAVNNDDQNEIKKVKVAYCTPVSNSNNKVYMRVEEPDCLVIHANKGSFLNQSVIEGRCQL